MEAEAEAAAEAAAEVERHRELRVGDAVEGQFGTDMKELWWPGTITKVWRGGKVDVQYDDGDTELKKPPNRVRRLQLHRSSKSSTGYKGVYRVHTGSFEVRLPGGLQRGYGGTFATVLEAAEKYARLVALEQQAEETEVVEEAEEEEAEEEEAEEEAGP